MNDAPSDGVDTSKDIDLEAEALAREWLTKLWPDLARRFISDDPQIPHLEDAFMDYIGFRELGWLLKAAQIAARKEAGK